MSIGAKVIGEGGSNSRSTVTKTRRHKGEEQGDQMYFW